mmetsp:Transcript_18845/g.33657  ORF Transcript_18845/g.33657 Transcript_18845/m.33657 type:complete len:355 (-) Transcript_18845:568-1632(-)
MEGVRPGRLPARLLVAPLPALDVHRFRAATARGGALPVPLQRILHRPATGLHLPHSQRPKNYDRHHPGVCQRRPRDGQHDSRAASDEGHRHHQVLYGRRLEPARLCVVFTHILYSAPEHMGGAELPSGLALECPQRLVSRPLAQRAHRAGGGVPVDGGPALRGGLPKHWWNRAHFPTDHHRHPMVHGAAGGLDVGLWRRLCRNFRRATPLRPGAPRQVPLQRRLLQPHLLLHLHDRPPPRRYHRSRVFQLPAPLLVRHVYDRVRVPRLRRPLQHAHRAHGRHLRQGEGERGAAVYARPRRYHLLHGGRYAQQDGQPVQALPPVLAHSTNGGGRRVQSRAELHPRTGQRDATSII